MSFPLKYQDNVFKTLLSMRESGRFPHALIFEGPEGSGKKTAAAYAAALLLCKGENAPCGVCSSCKKLKSNNHPDHTVLLPENKSRTISVEQVRAIKLSAYISPHEAECKVYFIPEAQALRPEAQNALLKLIEEPPEAAYFILTVPSRKSLLETVVSRSAVLAMRELSEDQIADVLRGSFHERDKGELALLCAGCKTAGEAICAANDPAARKTATDAAALLDLIAGGDRYGIIRLLNSFGRDREQFLKLLSCLRAEAINRLCAKNGNISALRTSQIVAIIDKASFAAAQNASLPLLSCAAANRLVNTAVSI